MHYVGVDSVEIAKERIRHRVATGGHGIPDADVERRYARSLENVKEIAPKVDELVFYDNSTAGGLKEIATCEKGDFVRCIATLPQWFVSVKEAIEKAHEREKAGFQAAADAAFDKIFGKKDAKKEAPENGKNHGQGFCR